MGGRLCIRVVLRSVAVALMVLSYNTATRAEEGLRLYAAGSLTAAMTDMLAQSKLPAAPPVFGPSGVLRERIEAGAAPDVFTSADLAQPRRLAAGRGGLPVILFARNSLCALSRPKTGLTSANLLDRMLDPSIRLATSTPGADPGGDYAWQVFHRADAVRPGAEAILQAKALKLVGGPDSKPLVPGKGPAEGVFLADAADIMLGYCSGAEGLRREIPDLVAVAMPESLAVGPAYGMVVLSAEPSAARFALFVMSEQGQAILARHGFHPVALPE